MDVFERYRFGPNHILNVNKVVFQLFKQTPPVISNKSKKWARTARSFERSQNIIVHYAMSASGLSVSPTFIFLCLNMTPSISHGGSPGSTCVSSKSGWMYKGLFVIWPKHFVLNFQSSIQNITLLSKENISSHTSLSSYNYCKANGITVVGTVVDTTMEVDLAGPSNEGISTSH